MLHHDTCETGLGVEVANAPNIVEVSCKPD